MEGEQLQRVKLPLLSISKGSAEMNYAYSDSGETEDLIYLKFQACNGKHFRKTEQELLNQLFLLEINEPYTNEDLISWTTFMTGAGFPCEFVLHNNTKYIKILGKNYTGKLHFLSGLTAIRYIIYHRYKFYDKICNTAIDLWNNSTLTEYEALIFAHMLFGAKMAYFGEDHALTEGEISGIYTPEELKSHYTGRIQSVNKCHSKKTTLFSSENKQKFIKYFENKNYEKLIEFSKKIKLI